MKWAANRLSDAITVAIRRSGANDGHLTVYRRKSLYIVTDEPPQTGDELVGEADAGLWRDIGPSESVCCPMPDRVATWKVILPNSDGFCVGYLRLDVSEQKWIARTRGDPDGKSAALIRRFDNRGQALAFLVARECGEREAAAP